MGGCPKSRRRRLVHVQKKTALRLGSGYRTVSAPTIRVVAEIITAEFLAQERRRAFLSMYQIGEEGVARSKDASLFTWHQQWILVLDWL